MSVHVPDARFHQGIIDEFRDRLFAAPVAAQPGFADNEKASERVIPVVQLRRA